MSCGPALYNFVSLINYLYENVFLSLSITLKQGRNLILAYRIMAFFAGAYSDTFR